MSKMTEIETFLSLSELTLSELNRLNQFDKLNELNSNSTPLDKSTPSIDILEPYMVRDLEYIQSESNNIEQNLDLLLESFTEINKMGLNKSSKRNNQIMLIESLPDIKQRCSLVASNIDNFSKQLQQLETLKLLSEEHRSGILSDVQREDFYNNYTNYTDYTDISEDFNIGDIGRKVTDAVVRPIQNTANNLSRGISSTVNRSIGKITGQFNAIGNKVNSSVNSVKSSVNNSVNSLKGSINNALNTVKRNANNVVQQTVRVAKEVPRQTKLITSMIGRKITEEFKKIQEFFKRFVQQMTRIFGLIVDKFKVIINEIVKISKIVAKFGENFYKKYLKPIFFEIFGVMKQVFEFIWKELIPILRKIVRWIIYDLPRLLAKLYRELKRFSINLYRNPLASGLLVLGVFIGLQVYMKHLLDTEMVIPHIILIFLTLSILWDQLMNNTRNINRIQQWLVRTIVKIFSSPFIKNRLRLSKDFGSNIAKSFIELLKVFSKNSTKFIIGFLILLVLIKFTSIKLYELVIRLFEFIWGKITDWIKSLFE